MMTMIAVNIVKIFLASGVNSQAASFARFSANSTSLRKLTKILAPLDVSPRAEAGENLFALRVVISEYIPK